MPILTADELRALTRRILTGLGTPETEAAQVADHLVEANLAGHDSHGVLRLPQYAKFVRDGQVRPGAGVAVVRQTPAMAVVDGRHNFGAVTMARALELALEKAGPLAVATVVVRNCNHVGRLGGFARRAALAGFACQIGVNSPGGRSVAPWGGIERRMGTNPLCLAAPGRAAPLVLDMTTSVAAEGKLRHLFQQQKPAPPGWIIDHTGQPTTDPAAFYGQPPGALLPLGGSVGYKGFGLSVLLDVLAGAMGGQGALRPDLTPGHNGVWLTLWQVAAFTPLEEYFAEVDRLAAWIKSARRLPGVDEILLPGEIEERTTARRLQEGIPVPEETWALIHETARAAGAL